MKRVFSNPLVALIAGLCLRVDFVLKFPASSGDTVLYEQIATNWLKHDIYGMDVGGAIIPVDLRMPGYPAFLATMYMLTGRTGADTRLWVMLAQIAVDLLSCLVIARLAALCPFTANYTAVPLTEVFASLWTALACCALVIAIRRVQKPDFLWKSTNLPLRKSVEYTALGAGWIVGAGTLFRPEAPILLIAAAIVFGGLFFLRGNYRRWFWVCLAMAFGCLMLLSPWAIRNLVTLGEPQFLAPKNSNLPGELVPYGFMAWEKTWLYRVRDCYLVPWRLNEEAIFVEDVPARAIRRKKKSASR